MGAHAGVFFFDKRPTADACDALRAGLQPIASDGVSMDSEDGLAMAHGAFHVWAGESRWAQPHRSASGVVATWDGRLDNRDDLLLRLGQRLTDETSDVSIALSVFERWGIEGLRFLIGDWSVAVWDGSRRTLHLARDYMGVRPLYYCATDRSVMWSTSLGELAQRTGRIDALSEEFAARFIALRLSTESTPYDNVRAVPTACCVSFSSTSTTIRRFWQPDPGVVRYRDPRQYEEQLRALWSEAVGARLRIDDVVWAELSGGLDSSSVVCMADALVKSGRVRARAIQPISHATLRSPEGDERRFIAEVEAEIGVYSDIVGVEEHAQSVDPEWDWVTPFALQGVGLACTRHVRERNGRLILSGRAGDAVMGGQPDNSRALFDDLAQGDVIAAASALRAWSRACRKPFVEIAWNLARAAMAPHGSDAVRDLRPQHSASALLTSRLHSTVGHEADGLTKLVAGVRASKRAMVVLLLGYSFYSRFDIPAQPPGAIYTYPFTHRPLVDFMLAIPGEQVCAPSVTRSLMRRAFEGLVPARVLRRTSKGYYPPAAMRRIRQIASSLASADRLEVVRRGWVDPVRFTAALRTLIDGGGSRGTEVRQILHLEQWLSFRDRRAPAVIPQRKEVKDYGVLNA